MIDAKDVKGSYLEYKGRPLVRQDADIYYGDLADKYHVGMMVMTEKVSPIAEGESVPDKVVVQLFAKDSKTPEKQTVANGLPDALETAAAWLDRYNKE